MAKGKRDEKGRIIDGKAQGRQFSPDYQPANPGRKKDPFKSALEELAQSDGQFVVAQNELLGLFDVREGEDGLPLITVRGEWARDAEGKPDKRLALITVQLPDAKAIVGQWFRDAKSRKDTVRTRSRETLFDRVLGKATQPLTGDLNLNTNPLKVVDDI
jgi:hypothetical protein